MTFDIDPVTHLFINLTGKQRGSLYGLLIMRALFLRHPAYLQWHELTQGSYSEFIQHVKRSVQKDESK